MTVVFDVHDDEEPLTVERWSKLRATPAGYRRLAGGFIQDITKRMSAHNYRTTYEIVSFEKLREE